MALENEIERNMIRLPEPLEREQVQRVLHHIARTASADIVYTFYQPGLIKRDGSLHQGKHRLDCELYVTDERLADAFTAETVDEGNSRFREFIYREDVNSLSDGERQRRVKFRDDVRAAIRTYK